VGVGELLVGKNLPVEKELLGGIESPPVESALLVVGGKAHLSAGEGHLGSALVLSKEVLWVKQ